MKPIDSVQKRKIEKVCPGLQPEKKTIALAPRPATPWSRLSKILALLLLVALNWSGILAVGRTFSYLSDRKTSSPNTIVSTSLNFSLNAGDWSPSEKLTAGSAVSRTIDIVKSSGSLNFQYNAGTAITGVVNDFCNTLQLEAKLGGVTKYNGGLAGLTFSPPIIIGSGGTDSWLFIVSLPSGSFDTETCQFKFVFNGWQENFAWGVGFSDTKELANVLADPSVPDSILIELAPPLDEGSTSDELLTPAQTLAPEQAAGFAQTDLGSSQTPPVIETPPVINSVINNETNLIDSGSVATGSTTDNLAGQTETVTTKIEITSADEQLTIENLEPFKEDNKTDNQTLPGDEKPAILEPAIVPANSNEPAVPAADNSSGGNGGDGGNGGSASSDGASVSSGDGNVSGSGPSADSAPSAISATE